VEMWRKVRRGVGEWRCGGKCGEVWESGDVADRAERCGRVEMWREDPE